MSTGRRHNGSSSKNTVRVNTQIRLDSARVIDQHGEMLGVLSIDEALRRAREVDLDLVEVSPNAVPPVCKIIDFGKFKYETQKKLHDARKNQKRTDTKEVKMRPNIAGGDYDVKLRNAKRFIAEGHRVRVSLVFRGREIAHSDVGMKVIDAFRADMEDVAKLEVAPKMEGRQIFMMLVPIK